MSRIRASGVRGARPLTRSGGSSPGGAPADSGNGSGSRATRILVLSAPELVGGIPDVFHRLLDAGAEVIFSGTKLKTLRIPAELLERPGTSAVELPLRRTGPAGNFVTVLRALADLTRFLGPELEEASWRRVLLARRVLKLLGHAEPGTAALQALELELPAETHGRLSETFRELERLVPPPPELVEAVDRLGVDAVVLVTPCRSGGFEPDAVKAARRLGIPSALLVFSWDNLSSKALLIEHPDRLLVWNELQVDEAVLLQGIPRERVDVVGAASFDRFFGEVAELAGSPPRDPASPTILYLCSSTNVSPEEPAVLAQWVAALRSSDDPRLRGARVVIRPHPKSTAVFESWTRPDERVSVVRPRGKSGGLAAALAEADVAVALNTSAAIEATIAGRPVLTFRAGAGAPGQEGSKHFPYLLEENGGFVIDAPDIAQHLGLLSAVLSDGRDDAAVALALERFVRPAGLEQPVSPLVASAVLELARRPTGAKR